MDRHQAGDELWKQKFADFGLADKFEFGKRDWSYDRGQKATVTCKTCGTTFQTTNLGCIFRGKIKRLTCPECGMRSDGSVCWPKSEACRKALAYYADGHSVLETAEKFGVPDYYIENAMASNGVKKTQEQRREAWRKSLEKAQKASNEVQKERALKKRVAHLDELGFDLVGENKVRCRKCGYEFERTLSHLTNGNVICQKCAEADKEKRALAEKEEKERRTAEREAERIRINPLGLSSYQLLTQEKLDAVHVCEVCGKTYTIRERTQAGEIKTCSDNGCCSNACARKKNRLKQRANGYPKNHLHRARRYGCEYDGSVTLKRLIKRDGLRCAICGGMCDPNDHEWTEHSGPKYPTLDHIVPLSKGGGHTWDNVQVAHAICNSRKRDTYEAG